MYLINKIDNDELIRFINDKYNFKESDIRKLKNTYDKIINLI